MRSPLIVAVHVCALTPFSAAGAMSTLSAAQPGRSFATFAAYMLQVPMDHRPEDRVHALHFLAADSGTDPGVGSSASLADLPSSMVQHLSAQNLSVLSDLSGSGWDQSAQAFGESDTSRGKRDGGSADGGAGGADPPPPPIPLPNPAALALVGSVAVAFVVRRRPAKF